MELGRESKINQLNQIIKEWSLSCTFDCYPKLFLYKNYFLRLMWLLLFVSLTGLTCVLVYKALFDYLAYEVVSKIQVINVGELEFPTITICDSNQMATEDAKIYTDEMWRNLTRKEFSNINQEEFSKNSHFKLHH